jgi:hypothetical protein
MSIHEGDMKRRLLLTATIACSMLAGATPSPAGYWNYGCKGGLGDTAVIFDRNALLIMRKALGKGEIAGLMNSPIFTFETADNNSGFLPVMKFANGAYPDQKIVLTEKSSKAISEQKGHIGRREKSTVTYRKTYRYERIGYRDEPEQADIVMECIEHMVTAP